MNRLIGVAVVLALTACGPGNPEAGPSGSATVPAATSESDRPTASAPATGPFAPRDDCAALSGAGEFRTALFAAVRARDSAALAALADPAIALDFGGGSGRDTLRQRLAGASGAKLWEELAAILPLGCAVQDGALVMPWYFAQAFDDPFSAMIVTGSEVALRSEAAADTAPLTTLSWQAVELVGGLQPGKPFQQVRVPGGVQGFVATSELRSVLDYRLIANRKDGAWRITALIAGD